MLRQNVNDWGSGSDPGKREQRRLAAELGTNHTRVARVLAKAGLQPHRLRRYLASDDPDFETKAADIIGLYLKPPVNAAVFCVPTYSSWLNQVGIWFSKIQRDVIVRGIFHSWTLSFLARNAFPRLNCFYRYLMLVADGDRLLVEVDVATR